MNQELSVSVIIPTKNRVGELRRCLNSISDQLEEGDEIIIVNGGSASDLDFTLNTKANIKIIHESTPGLSHAWNVGSRASTGEILAYLNDDSVPKEDWLSKLKYWFSRLPASAAIGGSAIDRSSRRMRKSIELYPSLWTVINVLFFDNRLFEYGYMTRWGGFSIGEIAPPLPIEVTALAGPNWAVKKDIYIKIGGFDESLPFHNSDGLFFVSLALGGFKMYAVPGMVVDHYPGISGSTRNIFNVIRDTYLFSKLLKPIKMKDKLKRTVYVLLTSIFLIFFTDDHVNKIERIKVAMLALQTGRKSLHDRNNVTLRLHLK